MSPASRRSSLGRAAGNQSPGSSGRALAGPRAAAPPHVPRLPVRGGSGGSGARGALSGRSASLRALPASFGNLNPCFPGNNGKIREGWDAGPGLLWHLAMSRGDAPCVPALGGEAWLVGAEMPKSALHPKGKADPGSMVSRGCCGVSQTLHQWLLPSLVLQSREDRGVERRSAAGEAPSEPSRGVHGCLGTPGGAAPISSSLVVPQGPKDPW